MDYDYLCERDDPSVIAIVHPQKQNTYESFFWKDKEILIPIVATLNDACLDLHIEPVWKY